MKNWHCEVNNTGRGIAQCSGYTITLPDSATPLPILVIFSDNTIAHFAKFNPPWCLWNENEQLWLHVVNQSHLQLDCENFKNVEIQSRDQNLATIINYIGLWTTSGTTQSFVFVHELSKQFPFFSGQRRQKATKAATIKFPSEQKSPKSFREHYVEENMTATKLIGLFRSKVRIWRNSELSYTPFKSRNVRTRKYCAFLQHTKKYKRTLLIQNLNF